MNVASIAKRGLFLASLLGISASAAFAQSVATVPYGVEDFEQWSAGAIYGNAPAYWTVQLEDGSFITNIGTVAEANNVLGLNTEGNELKLNLDPQEVLEGTSLYVDAKVKFVVSEDDPTNIPADVKTAVFLNVNSNLVIYHGVYVYNQGVDDYILTSTNTVISAVTLDPANFYQLTIETSAADEGCTYFKYYIDGTAVLGPAGLAYSDDFVNEKTVAAPGGNWFAAATTEGGNSLNSLAFQGTGFVDDISVAATSPLSSTWTLTVPQLSNGSFQTNGVALADGNHVFDTADSITVALVADAGYTAAGTTNSVAVNFPVTFADIAANDTITLAATFTQLPVAVVDGNGNVVAGYSTLAAAIAGANGGTVKLFDDVDLASTIVITDDVTIDLNGNDISADGFRAIWVKSGDVVITGTGTINGEIPTNGAGSVIRVGDAAANAEAAALMIDTNVVVTSATCYGITVFGYNNADSDPATADMSLDLYGTVAVTSSGDADAAISGQGRSDYLAVDITIHDSAVVTSANSAAVYFPGAGTLTTEGSLTGLHGIVARAGNVFVNGGSVTATGTGAGEVIGDSNSTTVPYAAIVYDTSAPNAWAHYAAGDTVTINGGTISSAVSPCVLQLADEGDVASVAIPTTSAARFSDANADGVPAGYALVADGNLYKIAAATYTLTYVTAQGVAPAAVSYTVESNDFALAAAPEVQGYTFLGWVIGSTTNAAGALFDVSENLANTTATAAWEQQQGPTYPNSATAGGVTIISLADNGSNITFGTPAIASGNVTVPFTGAIAGEGTVASGFYVQYTTAVNGAVSTVPASVTVNSATAGTATFAIPANTTAMFLVGLTDAAE